jgi:predicted anti-sigma-YlaC factor YlaD
MFCDEVIEAIEPIAAGDVAAEARIGEHLRTCADCAAALESARRVEQLLRQRSVPAAPAQFTTATLARVRRARWRSDQMIDAGFNLAVALLVVAIVAVVWLVLNRSGMAAVSNDVFQLFGTSLAAATSRIAPAVPLYAGAAALLATALGIWWWAERGTA